MPLSSWAHHNQNHPYYTYTPPPHPNIVEAPRLQTLVVVWLPLARLARAAPEGELAGGVGGRQPVQGVSVY